MESFASAMSGFEPALKGAGVAFGFGIVLSQISVKERFPANDARPVYEDREGNIWFGTADHGLVRLREKRVETYSTQEGLTNSDAITILEDRDGRIWAGTFEGGLHLLQGERWRPFQPPGLSPDARHIISLCQTRDGALWLGSYGAGAFRWHGDRVEEKIHKPESVARAIFEDRAGAVWIGTSKSGVGRFQDKQVQWFTTENGLSLNFVTAIAQDGAGDIWVGTEDGLNRIRHGTVARFFKADGLGASPHQCVICR